MSTPDDNYMGRDPGDETDPRPLSPAAREVKDRTTEWAGNPRRVYFPNEWDAEFDVLFQQFEDRGSWGGNPMPASEDYQRMLWPIYCDHCIPKERCPKCKRPLPSVFTSSF